jgi:murein DD-endopeptidase MepM/ murein hydrolase activator NlpD
MLDVHRSVVRRWIALVTVTTLLAVPSAAGATPNHLTQEDPSEGEDEAATDRAIIDVDETLAQEDPAAVVEAINLSAENVTTELDNLRTAEAKVDDAVTNLADADSAVLDTTFAIEELTEQSDAVVIEAFMNPPAENAFDVFAAESISDATVKQGVLDLRADESAGVLDELAEKRETLETQRADEREMREVYAEAKAAADAALVDLTTASSQQTEFVLAVQRRLDEGIPADLTPEEQRQAEARRLEIQGAIDAVQRQAALEEAAERAELERQRIEEENRRLNRIWCPVDGGGLHFVDTWGAARSGGRSHKGTDMMADYGTPTVAPVSGRVEHRSTSLGGLSWYVYGDNGHKYYGTHLQGYEQVGVGHVDAGSVIGYVGASGNAPDNAPHLHFEWMPNGGSSVNPYAILDEACPNH